MTVRYLDPPLHEFLPTRQRRTSRRWPRSMGITVEELKDDHRQPA